MRVLRGRPVTAIAYHPWESAFGLAGLVGLGIENCDPRDTACVERNLIAQGDRMYQDDTARAQSRRDLCYANARLNGQPVPGPCDSNYPLPDRRNYFPFNVTGNVPLAPETQVYVKAGPSTPPPSPPTATTTRTTEVTYAPRLSFENLGGSSSALVSGDEWRVTISGAKPGSQVTVTGGKNGDMATTSMGAAGPDGVFQLRGRVGDGEIGDWYEEWKAGGVTAGSVRFTVSAKPAAATTTTATATKPPVVVVTKNGEEIVVQNGKPGGEIPWLPILLGGGFLLMLARK